LAFRDYFKRSLVFFSSLLETVVSEQGNGRVTTEDILPDNNTQKRTLA
jgi:hypothetical protein